MIIHEGPIALLHMRASEMTVGAMLVSTCVLSLPRLGLSEDYEQSEVVRFEFGRGDRDRALG